MVEVDQVTQSNYQRILEESKKEDSDVLRYWINNREEIKKTMDEDLYEKLNHKFIKTHGYGINS